MEFQAPKFDKWPSFKDLWFDKWQMRAFKQILTEIWTDKDKRMAYCSQSTFFFALYYFQNDMFGNEPTKWQYELAQALSNEDYDYVMLLMFRGAGKSIYFDADILRKTYFNLAEYIVVLSADMDNVWRNLWNIANILQGKNDLLYADFWDIFFEETKAKKMAKWSWDPRDELKFSQRTSIFNFKTKNWVKIEWRSVLSGDFRWLKDGTTRPTDIYLDDIETFFTFIWNKTTQIKKFISSLIAALNMWARVAIAWNYISDNGTMRMLREMLEHDPRTFFMMKAILEPNEDWVLESTWKDRWFDWTKEEYLEMLTKDPSLKMKIKSIELEKERMNKAFPGTFDREMMNKPITSEWLLISKDVIDWYKELAIQMSDVNVNKEFRKQWSWTIWRDYEFREEVNRYCSYLISMDPALWNGWDHTAIYVINVDTRELVARFMSNVTPPELVMHELRWAFNTYWKPLITFETNWVWEWFKSYIKMDDELKRHTVRRKNRSWTRNIIYEDYGDNTSWKSKQDYYLYAQQMMWTEDMEQKVLIYDIDLINECSSILLDEVVSWVYRKDIDKQEWESNHRDLFSAFGIWLRRIDDAVVFGAERVTRQQKVTNTPQYIVDALSSDKSWKTIRPTKQRTWSLKNWLTKKSYRI